MTSPVDTSVKFFHSGMVGAPTFASGAGKLIALLDACLVDGFGAINLTGITVSGGVATAAFSGTFPALPEAVVQIGGATGAYTALNGEQKVTAIGGGTFQFATAAPAGAASGTITAKMAPAGWSKAFTGTNLAAYRSNDVTSNRRYLRVNDTNALDARVVAYETMTAISTGTNLMPTSAQVSGGLYWCKAMASYPAEPLSWMVFANGKRFTLWIAVGEAVSYSTGVYDAMTGVGFGDFTSWKSTVDAYNTMLLGQLTPSSTTYNFGNTLISAGGFGLNILRSHTNAVGSLQAVLQSLSPAQGYVSGREEGMGPANIIGNQLLQCQSVLAIEPGLYGPRGQMKELVHVPQKIPDTWTGLTKGSLVDGAGPIAGRKLMVVPSDGTTASVASGVRAVMLLDVTGPWE